MKKTKTRMNKKTIITFFLVAALITCSLFPAVAAENTTTNEISTTKAEERYLLTIVCEPQMELTEYDTVILRVYRVTSGESYSFKLYGYNHFSDKFVMPTGDYLITEIALQDRPDVVLINTKPEFTITGTDSLIVPITNSLIVHSETTVSATETSEITTFHNPFAVEPDESSGRDSNSNSVTVEPDGSESFTNLSTSSFAYTELTEERTGDEPNILEKSSKIILVIISAIIFIGVAIFVILRKRFKEE